MNSFFTITINNTHIGYVLYIIYIDTGGNCSTIMNIFINLYWVEIIMFRSMFYSDVKKAPLSGGKHVIKSRGPEGLQVSNSRPLFCLILPHEIMPLSISQGEFFYSVLRLLSQFTRPKPILLNRIAPGAGITSAIPSM